MSLYLVGMRAVGKSTAGRLAASRLGVEFLDTDEQVARDAGRSVAAIFAEAGEHLFRALERDVVLGAIGCGARIVAIGAGAVGDEAVRRALHRSGRAVWLAADLELIRGRLGRCERPSLTGREPADEAAQLLAEREPLYRACARTRIDVTRLGVSEVADELERIWSLPPDHIVR